MQGVVETGRAKNRLGFIGYLRRETPMFVRVSKSAIPGIEAEGMAGTGWCGKTSGKDDVRSLLGVSVGRVYSLRRETDGIGQSPYGDTSEIPNTHGNVHGGDGRGTRTRARFSG